MSDPIASTKLYRPAPRSIHIDRPRLVDRLNNGLSGKLTLLSAAAGSGKTTLLGLWLAECSRPAAWLSLEAGDNNPSRFLACLFAAAKTIAPELGDGILKLLQSPQPPPAATLLTSLVNAWASFPQPFVLVLDDFHLIEDGPVNEVVSTLLERLPSNMHLVISTRKDPGLPLANLRVRHQLTEVRSPDLTFDTNETTIFMNRVMGLHLSPDEIVALEARTEGWIAGLQLAALSMQGVADRSVFIRNFSGSHRHVGDYLMEEVFAGQPASIQAFLFRTSILDRMCGPLCDALIRGSEGADESVPSQETLGDLERSNLFIVPLDNERRWFRYHHLFSEWLRRHRSQNDRLVREETALHLRASEWYEANRLEMEAFRHAAAARDLDRAIMLLEGKGMPLLFRGAAVPIREWLDSLSAAHLNARPSLWVWSASSMLMAGQTVGVEQKLAAAERAMHGAESNEATRDLYGHIASIRSMLAVSRHQAETIVQESRKALAFLHPHNLPVRTAAAWALGYANHLLGDRNSAAKAYSEALAGSKSIGHVVITVMAATGLGSIHEAECRLHAAVSAYREALDSAGSPPLPVACDAYLGLARVHYEWNDLLESERYGSLAAEMARTIEQTDREVACVLFLAKLKLAQGEEGAAAAIVAEAEAKAKQEQYTLQSPAIAELRIWMLLREERSAAAAELARAYGNPISQARTMLAAGDAAKAVAMLENFRQQSKAGDLPVERLKASILMAIASQSTSENIKAKQMLAEAIAWGETGGFIRSFADEGESLAFMLREWVDDGAESDYVRDLLTTCIGETGRSEARGNRQARRADERILDPLSDRELEVLRLVAQGLSNHEIGERLFLALSTVKGHNRIIFDKLQVKRRTEAVAKARMLNLL